MMYTAKIVTETVNLCNYIFKLAHLFDKLQWSHSYTSLSNYVDWSRVIHPAEKLRCSLAVTVTRRENGNARVP